jgi:dihydroceramidase
MLIKQNFNSIFQLFCKNSSINFCEPDYIYSIYIAEFYNTLSGLFLCLSSILFYYRHIKTFNDDLYLKCKLYNINALLFIVGLGTILFHSQLLYIFQLIDEIPMLLIIMNYLNLLNELWSNIIPTKNFDFNLNFQIKTISIICISGFFNDSLQVFLFQGTMILCSVNYILVTNKLHNKIKEWQSPFESISVRYKFCQLCQLCQLLSNEINYYNKFCFKIAVLSFSLWLIEQLFCEYVQDYYFHAFWHFLSSIGMYYYNYIILLYIKLYLTLNNN